MSDDRLLEKLLENPDDQSLLEAWIASDADNTETFPDDADTSEFDTPEYRERFKQIFTDAAEQVDREKAAAKKKAKVHKAKKITIWVAAVATVAMSVILFTEPGRALYKSIVSYINGYLYMQINIPDGSYPANTDFEFESFDTLEDAASFLGYPMLGIKDGAVWLESVEVSNFVVGIKITSRYLTKNDTSFDIVLYITDSSLDDFSLIADATGAKPFYYTLSNGEKLECYTNENGEFFGIASWSNIQLHITSDTIGRNELVNYVDKISTIE